MSKMSSVYSRCGFLGGLGGFRGWGRKVGGSYGGDKEIMGTPLGLFWGRRCVW